MKANHPSRIGTKDMRQGQNQAAKIIAVTDLKFLVFHTFYQQSKYTKNIFDQYRDIFGDSLRHFDKSAAISSNDLGR